jgi:hypothetical protein
MQEHTAGPWQFVNGVQILSSGGEHIAEVIESFDRDGAGKQYLVNDITLQGNGRLIATAPEGFELAQHIMAMADDAYFVGHPEWQTIVDQAERLIAKAKP